MARVLFTSLILASAAMGTLLGPGGQPPEGSPSSSAPLPFYYDLYSFRGDTGTTRVVASFAVRARDLDRESVDGLVRYRFNVSLVVADTAVGAVARADDSVFVALPRALDGDHLLHAHLETEAQPSGSTVGRMIMIAAPNPGNGQLYNQLFPIPDYSGDELMLSDIALGIPEEEGGWRRGGAALALMPSGHFPGGPFDVFYEIYNLPSGHPYVTEIAIEPADPSGTPRPDSDQTVRVRFSGESRADTVGVLPELRRVEAALEPGWHRLSVTVTDQLTGRSAEGLRLVLVREWDAGTTMVHTCPVKPGVDRPGCPEKGMARGSSN